MAKNRNSIKKFIFQMEQRVPYIPDFSDAWNILKILLLSLLLCVIYSFTQVERATEFYLKFWVNLKIFTPYVVSQLLLLIFFAKKIKKLSPFKAILLLILLNFICVYIVHCAIAKKINMFWVDMDTAIAQLCVSFGILFFFLIYFDWREKNLDPANNLAKLSFLQGKMRPHFLFNTISSVIALIKKEPDTAKKMLLNLSELLRVSIREEDITVMCNLKDEITLCEKYLAIEKIRLGDRLQIIWTKDEDLMLCKVPQLCLQPLLENSILHGIQNMEEGGTVEISIRKNLLDRIIMEIKNPIAQKVHNKDDNHNNISLSNLHQRLKLYYNGEVEMTHQAINNVYYIYIEIPIVKFS